MKIIRRIFSLFFKQRIWSVHRETGSVLDVVSILNMEHETNAKEVLDTDFCGYGNIYQGS